MRKNEINNLIIEGYEDLDFSEKSDLWAGWSRKGSSFPPDIDDIIIEINVDMNLDIYEQYGFKVAYYMFMENWDRNTTEEYFKVDDYYRIYGT